MLGRTIGGPYHVVNGDKVIGPEPGAVVHGRPDNKKFKRVPGSSPAAAPRQARAAPRPTPTPGPGPGLRPGTIEQPGPGIVPRAADGVHQWPLLVPVVQTLVDAAVLAACSIFAK